MTTGLIGLVTRANDTVLQPSSIRHYRFGDHDPFGQYQPTRVARASDRRNLLQAATSSGPDLDALRKNTTERGLALADQVLYLLSHDAFNFNNKTEVRNDPIVRSKIRAAVSAGRPIEIAYPLMCKIGLPAKQWYNCGPTAGEEATLLFFRHMNNALQSIYPPGLHIRIASDATLYAEAFRIPQVTAKAYAAGVADLISASGVDSFVSLYDYKELLEESDYPAVLERVSADYRSAPNDLLEGIDVHTLRESVRASIDLRPLGLTYSDYADLYSLQRNTANPHWHTVEVWAREAFDTIVPIRVACGRVNALATVWPEAVRASCHKGRKNGSMPLGLRVFPEYFKASKFLPYHGVPLLKVKSRDATGHSRLQMDVHPEIFLMGRPELTRVTWGGNGDTYFYDGSHLADEIALTA